MTRYVYKRGDASSAVMHLARFHPATGDVVGVLCATTDRLDTSCNVPLGRPICSDCRAVYTAETAPPVESRSGE